VFDLGDEGLRGGVGGARGRDEAAGVRGDGAELGGEIAFERRQVGAVDLGTTKSSDPSRIQAGQSWAKLERELG
jgi:hypothetical protein